MVILGLHLEGWKDWKIHLLCCVIWLSVTVTEYMGPINLKEKTCFGSWVQRLQSMATGSHSFQASGEAEHTGRGKLLASWRLAERLSSVVTQNSWPGSHYDLNTWIGWSTHDSRVLMIQYSLVHWGPNQPKKFEGNLRFKLGHMIYIISGKRLILIVLNIFTFA